MQKIFIKEVSIIKIYLILQLVFLEPKRAILGLAHLGLRKLILTILRQMHGNTLFVPQDINGHIKLMNGAKNYERHLDSLLQTLRSLQEGNSQILQD